MTKWFVGARDRDGGRQKRTPVSKARATGNSGDKEDAGHNEGIPAANHEERPAANHEEIPAGDSDSEQ